MNNKCDYINFFNEFNQKIGRKLKLIPLYNGYYFPDKYKKHLQFTLEKFKHDVLYQLPFNSHANKEVFLAHLHQELRQKQIRLEGRKKKKENKQKQKSKYLLPKIQSLYSRRNRYMCHCQTKMLNNAIDTVEQAVESYGYRDKTNCQIKHETRPETRAQITPDIIWPEDKVGLIQLIKSLIRTKTILIGPLRENEAISIIANFFNTSINTNNLSSFSRAIHSNNNDYQPGIFTKIINGYELIAHELREKQEILRK